MKFQTILLVGMLIELSLVPLLDAKRSFGITRSRNKNKGPSVRRNQHGQYEDAAPPAPKPAPEIKKSSYSAPSGPQYSGGPPGYPGIGHNSGPHYGAPPAYSPSYASPPGYSNVGFNNQQRFGQPGSFNSHNSGAMPMGGMGYGAPMGGAMPMGGAPMGYGQGYGRSSGFGSGIMTNLFAGLAGYQLAKAFSGGHHRDREVIVIDNRQPVNGNPEQVPNIEQVASPDISPESPSHISVSTEIPQAPVNQVGPATNEYNFYGIPQYGIPLYGYSLPSQITDYYQSAVISLPQDIPQPALEQTDPPLSEK